MNSKGVGLLFSSYDIVKFRVEDVVRELREGGRKIGSGSILL